MKKVILAIAFLSLGIFAIGCSDEDTETKSSPVAKPATQIKKTSRLGLPPTEGLTMEDLLEQSKLLLLLDEMFGGIPFFEVSQNAQNNHLYDNHRCWADYSNMMTWLSNNDEGGTQEIQVFTGTAEEVLTWIDAQFDAGACRCGFLYNHTTGQYVGISFDCFEWNEFFDKYLK